MTDHDQKPSKQMQSSTETGGKQKIERKPKSLGTKSKDQSAVFTLAVIIVNGVMALATVAMAGATFYLARSAHEQSTLLKQSLNIAERSAKAASDSAAAAKTSADAADETLKLNLETAKPSIRIEHIEAAGPLSISPKGIRATLRANLVNSGRLAAENVFFLAEMSLEPRVGRRNPRVAQEYMCDKAQKFAETTKTGNRVLPDATNTPDGLVEVSARMVKDGTRIEAVTNRLFIVPIVYGCIHYVAHNEARLLGFMVEFSVYREEENSRARFYLDESTPSMDSLVLNHRSNYSR